MAINSEALRRLNTVKIYYIDGDKPVQLFEDANSPLYLVGEVPSIALSTPTGDSLLGGATKSLLSGPWTAAIVQGISSRFDGRFKDFSGCIDVPSKFVFQGSEPIKLPGVKCMLINREGWDKSIAPTLNAIVKWVLPSNYKAADGSDYIVGNTFVDTLEKQEGTLTAGGEWNEDLNNGYSLLVKGLKAVKDWIGDVKLLNIPEQFEMIANKGYHTKLVIGPYDDCTPRFTIPDLFIEGVNITIPKTYMLNSSGDPEPDHVNIEFSFKSLRQTTTSMIKF